MRRIGLSGIRAQCATSDVRMPPTIGMTVYR
jgi:hypothetical protein